jgi:hypothetical protein
MGTYLSRAIAYIRDNGDEVEHARLAGLLGWPAPEPKVVRAVVGRQNDDGGFPYGLLPGRPSSLAATLTALRWMEDLRLLTTAAAERAAGYLLMVQRPHGAWEETPAVLPFQPGRLSRPGDAVARAYGTAQAALWAIRLLGARHDAVLRAARYLRSAGPLGADAAVDAVVAAVLMTVDGAAPPAVVQALSRTPDEAWTPARQADALAALHLAGVPASFGLVADGLRRLRAWQRPDGGWTSEDGADHDVDVSLHVLGVLLRYGAPPRGQDGR